MLKYLTAADYKHNTWTGGETTELFIYPPQAELDQRNFQCRISSATVNMERSEFSDFSGYQRFLQILQGEIRLQVGQDEPLELPQLAYHYFPGEAKTVSEGQCRDFNVIYQNPVSIDNDILLAGDQEHLQSDQAYFIFNPNQDAVDLEVGSEKLRLASMAAIWVVEENLSVTMEAGQAAILIAIKGLEVDK